MVGPLGYLDSQMVRFQISPDVVHVKSNDYQI